MDIINGFDFLFSNPLALLFVAIGAFTGVVVGAIPGLTASAAIAGSINKLINRSSQ